MFLFWSHEPTRANGNTAAAFLRANPDRFESVLLIGDKTDSDRERTPVMDHSYAEACFLLVLKRGGPEGSEHREQAAERPEAPAPRRVAKKQDPSN